MPGLSQPPSAIVNMKLATVVDSKIIRWRGFSVRNMQHAEAITVEKHLGGGARTYS